MALNFLLAGMYKQYLRPEGLLTLCVHGGTAWQQDRLISACLSVWSALQRWLELCGQGHAQVTSFYGAILQKGAGTEPADPPVPPPRTCLLRGRRDN